MFILDDDDSSLNGMDRPSGEDLIAALAFMEMRLATKRARRQAKVARRVDASRINAARKHLDRAWKLLFRVQLPLAVRKDLKKRGLL